MKDVVEYLKNPMKKGIYNNLYKIDMEKIDNFFEHIEKMKHPGSIDAIMYRDKYYLENPDLRFILSAIISMSLYNKNHQIFFDYFISKNKYEEIYKEKEKTSEDYIDPKYETLSNIFNEIFDSAVLMNTPDFLYINELKSDDKYKLLEICTLKDKTTSLFENYLKSLPFLDDTFTSIKKRHTSSSRYIYRPYNKAINIWLNNQTAIHVPKDIRSLILAASKYHDEYEWRTSVILSAIVVEMILADLYEENYKIIAPDVPLGVLFEKVKQKKPLPSEISSHIESVNKARISAVHRSRFPVSDQDSVMALFGVTNLVLWFFDFY